MSDSIKELADLNTNARVLLEKHSETLKSVKVVADEAKKSVKVVADEAKESVKVVADEAKKSVKVVADEAKKSVKVVADEVEKSVKEVVADEVEKIESISSSRRILLWSGNSTGGNLTLNENVDNFDFLLIDFDLSTGNSGNSNNSWHQSIVMTHQQIVSRETFNEAVDKDHFTVINSTTFNYRRAQSNNCILRIEGVKL